MATNNSRLSSIEYTEGEPDVSADSFQEERNTTRRLLGFTQVRALVHKNALTKLRTPMGTFFELLSPVFMMLILVAAYQLSEVTETSARQYSAINMNLPGPWLQLANQATVLILGVDTASEDVPTTSERREFRRMLSTSDPQHGFTLLHDLGLHRRMQENAAPSVTTDTIDSTLKVLEESNVQITSLMSSPIPVPTFEQFVSASLGLSSLVDPEDMPIILSDTNYGKSWGNLLTLGTLHLTPNSAIVDEFYEYLNSTYPAATSAIRFRIHQSEAEAIEFINNNLDERTWGLIDFSKFASPTDIEYKIRMNYTTLPNTNEIVNFVSIGLDTSYERYYLSGYLTLQQTINQFAMNRLGCESSQSIWSMPMPTAEYNQNAFFQSVGYLLGLTIAMAFMYPTSRNISSMVEEKELRIKETLYILGIRPWAHWCSWMITCLWVYSIITVLVTWILTSNVFMHSNPAYIFVFTALFSTSTIGFCFVVAACFSRAKLAAIVGPMALFASLLPRFIFFGTNRFEAIQAKRWASFLPCTAFAFGADIIADYEYAELGVQSWNANEGEYSFNTAISFLFLDTVLYIFLGWYLELVIPRQYGMARPWYFLVTPQYWRRFFCCGSGLPSGPARNIPSAVVEGEDFESMQDTTLNPSVVISDLVKNYKRNADVPPAVNHLNLTLYDSQITCLLGHNGAGKTSTISMLTGLFSPTSGDCFINGYSIVDDTDLARQSMGVCPQHNVLFDQLTVTEHLNFFQRIKGIKPTKDSLRGSAQEIGLGDYLRTTSIALSGGNKRKLSLAIALCGDPTFLLLDEPTSGMDVASRRACWELLRKKRLGRVTLLTTHFLDEASLLADRIAVMKEGKLQCCGSELFLKNRFGLGYNLTAVLNDARPPALMQIPERGDEVMSMENGTNLLNGSRPSSDASASILAFLNEYIPGTKLIRKYARELTFRFPQGTEERFADVFDALEQQRESLAVGAYGITDTTLEEIFLQLAETELPGEEIYDVSEKTDDLSKSIVLGSDSLNTSKGENAIVSNEHLQPLSPLKQILLLYRKRLTVQRRDSKGFFFQILLPVLLCGLVLLILTLEVVLAGPPIEMSLGLYGSSSSGFNSRINVPVGGGMTIEESTSRKLSLLDDVFRKVSTTIQEEYPNADFVHLEEALSSKDVSQYLLDSYNNHSMATRYGSFAIDDTINMSMAIDWDALRDDLGEYLEAVSRDIESLGVVDLNTLFGVNGTLLEANFTISEVREFFEDAAAKAKNMTAGYSLNTTHTQLLNATDIEKFVNSVLASNVTIDVTDLVQTLEDAFTDFVSNASVTLDTGALKETTSAAIDNIVTGAVSSQAINGTSMVQSLREALTNLPVELKDSNSTMKMTMANFFNTLLSTITFGELQDYNATTADEISQSLLSRGEVFDRDVIVDGMLMIFDELLEPFGGTTNTSKAIVDTVIQAFDDAVAQFNTSLTSAPNDLLVLPVLALDELAMALFDRFGENSTLSFDTISEFLDDENVTLSFEAVKDFLDENWNISVPESLYFSFDNVTDYLEENWNVTVLQNWTFSFEEITMYLDDHWNSTNYTVEEVIDIVKRHWNSTIGNSSLSLSEISNFLRESWNDFVGENSTLSIEEISGYLTQRWNETVGENSTLSCETISNFLEVVWNDTMSSDEYIFIKVERMWVNFSSPQVLVVDGIYLETMSEIIANNDTITLGMNKEAVETMDNFLPRGLSNLVVPFQSDVSILHNSSSPHAVGVFNQAYMEYLFKQCTGDPISARLVSVNHPLPLTDQQAIEIKTILSVLASIFLLIPLCYVPGAFIVFLVKERMSKSKHLQLVSGVDLTSYWISSYLWDLTLWTGFTLLIMIAFLIYGRQSAVVFVGEVDAFVATMALTFGYGLSVLPFSYLLSRGFKNHTSAQIAIMGILFLCGFVGVTGQFILVSLPKTKEVGEAIAPLLRWYPPYNIGEGFIRLSRAYWEREILGTPRFPLDWDVTGKNLAIIYGLALPYFSLLLLLEYSDDGGAGGPIGRVMRKVRSTWTNRILRRYGVQKAGDGVSLMLDDGLDSGQQEDDDVVNEQVYVKENKETLRESAAVLLVNMWKVYPPSIGIFGSCMMWIQKAVHLVCCFGWIRKRIITTDEDEEDKSNLPKRAVRGLSTAIMDGETYGLLGVNGAGKTTALGVLSGDIAPTGGEAYVAGHDITGVTPGGVSAARKHIGFCPQVDPLLDLMTGRETLRMFGRLRGIPEDKLESTVVELLARLTLTPHADKVSESYSGGNKRKLSLGIALIGDPRVLFIDEASSGMDPSTRRKTWALIEKAAQSRSVVLTSHSMEEVEALCTRLGIMVKGQFLCLGSVQHLKSKYMDGYTIDVHCESGTHENQMQEIVSMIQGESVGCKLSERHGHFLRFDITSVGLGGMFRKLHELQVYSAVSNYSISQCSLESVFMKLVESGNSESISPVNEG